MALSDFPNAKKVNYGDGANWTKSVGANGENIRTCTEADAITIEYMTNPPPSETIQCPVGTTVTVSNGNTSVNTP